MATKKTHQYKIGEHVVYPLQGVGLIKDIKEKEIKGVKTTVYVIYFNISDMLVSIPEGKLAEVGLRGLVSAETAKKALNSISEKYEPVAVDWKARYQMNMDLVKEGSIFSIVKVVQGLFHRSKVKELPVQERKLYDNAMQLLIDECSYSMGIEPEEVEKKIYENLNK